MRSLTQPVRGLRVLLQDIIDYAGLFPPARLDLDEAARNFARYYSGPYSWMLGRFVVPASSLEDLGSQSEFFVTPPSARLTVLLNSGADPKTLVASIRQGLGLVASFADAHAGRVRIESLEVAWPDASLSRDDAASTLDSIDDVVRHVLGPSVTTFIETSWRKESTGRLETLSAAIARQNLDRVAFGLKLRSGGLTPDLVPGVDEMARFIATAHCHGVPFKATAGLHHPTRNVDQNVGAMMFGFLNVFAGAALLHADAIDEAQLRDVLLEEDAEAFRFDAGLHWRDVGVGHEAIARARAFALSFGSCSFDEPIDDLLQLGLL
jgi:hypothetical protein